MGKKSVDKEKPEVDWNLENKRLLVDSMKLEIESYGFFGDNGTLKPEQLTRIVGGFNKEKGSPDYTRDQISSQISALKKEYNIVQKLTELSGFGWCAITESVTAPTPVRDDYIQKHPETKKYFGKKYPLFEDLEAIYTGTLATGSFAASNNDSKQSKRKRTASNADIDKDFASPGQEQNGQDSPPIPRRSPRQHSTSSNKTASSTKKGSDIPPNGGKDGKKDRDGGNKNGKKDKDDAILKCLDRIISNQERASQVEATVALVIDKYSHCFVGVAERARFLREIAKVPAYADVFLSENEDGRVAFIESFLE